MTLADFAEHALALVQHKDLIKKQISEIHKKSDVEYEIVYNDKIVALHISPTLEKAHSGTIICDNTKKNVDAVVQNWDELIKLNTTILFLNVKTGGNWSLHPKTHQKIMGSDNILKGLKSIYANCA